MLSREFTGILLLVALGISATGDMNLSKYLEASKRPYWHLLGGAMFLYEFLCQKKKKTTFKTKDVGDSYGFCVLLVYQTSLFSSDFLMT